MQNKVLTPEALSEALEPLRSQGRKIVHCHGVFDLIHVGHIRYFNSAKKFGDILVATLVADRFVKRGPGRPVFKEALRAEALANLEAVDFVCIDYHETAIEAIRAVRPHFYVKGADYKNKDGEITEPVFEEESAVRAAGGELVFTDDVTFSSSHILNNFFPTYAERTIAYLREFSAAHTADEVFEQVNRISQKKILVIGDAIVDEYCWCSPLGKSSKENIVANRYLSREYFAGGALATANHTAQLSDHVELITMLGDRNSHHDFISSHLNPTIKPVFFRRENCVTTVKRRFVSEGDNRKLFEVCYLDDHPLRAQEEKTLLDYLKRNIASYDLVIVSDFGHGMMTDRAIEFVCDHAKALAVNVQTNSANLGFNLVTKYKRADFICIDEAELRFATQDRHSDLTALVTKVYQKLDPRMIFVTRGFKGSLSFSPLRGFHETPAFTDQSVDKVGAGDAFFAYASPCYLAEMSQELVGFVGNAAGAIAVNVVCNREPVNKVDFQKFVIRLLKI